MGTRAVRLAHGRVATTRYRCSSIFRRRPQYIARAEPRPAYDGACSLTPRSLAFPHPIRLRRTSTLSKPSSQYTKSLQSSHIQADTSTEAMCSYTYYYHYCGCSYWVSWETAEFCGNTTTSPHSVDVYEIDMCIGKVVTCGGYSDEYCDECSEDHTLEHELEE